MRTNFILLGAIVITFSIYGNNHVSTFENISPFNIIKTQITHLRSSSNLINDSLDTLNKKFTIVKLDNTKGLSNSSINTIFQDSENLLWIGTWDGLNRYDGNKFETFRPELNNENSISNQVILKISEDNEGKIWVLTMHGLNRFDKKQNKFERFYFSKKNDPPQTESEFNMALNPLKEVFCAVKNWGFGYFNGTEFKVLESKNLPKNDVKKMEFTTRGDLLVLFDNNDLYLITIKTNNGVKKIISNVKKVSRNIKIFEIMPNEKVCLVSVLEGDARIYSLIDNSYQKIDVNNIQNIIGYYNPDGLVLSNKKGYFLINKSGISHKKPWLKYIENQKITTLIKGNENIIWCGTDGDGLFKIYAQRKSFNLVSKEQVPKLDGGIIRAFLKVDGDSFWVGTKGKGLFRFSNEFYLNPNVQLNFKNFNESNSIINNSVYALCKGQNNLIFIGSDGVGINVFDIKKSKLLSWSDIKGSDLCSYFKFVYTIYQDSNGFIWIGTNGYGMIRFKIESSNDGLRVTNFKKYIANNNGDGGLSSNIIFSIIPRNNDELWIGTRLGGLNLFKKNTGTFKVFKNIKNNIKSLSNNDILCLYTDKNNNLWIGTSLGLNLLKNFKDNKPANFRRFTVKDGLPNNTIHGIVSDKQSNLWLSTNLGLSNYLIEESKFINYTKSEGLQNNEFADGAYYKDVKSNMVFMGGIKGFNYFSPNKISESTFIPNILIDKISGQNQELLYYQGLVVSPNSTSFPSIILNHNQNFFNIEVAALSYINNEKCQFRYKLNNFDSDWNYINNRKIITFTNVPKGSYSLWLKWSNNDGIWSRPVHAIDIKIKPVYWQSNIAFVIYAIILLLFILFVWSYYNKQNSLRQNIIFRKREEEIHQNRLTLFTNIAHEFQTPLTLIVGPVQKLTESTNLSIKNQKFIKMIQRNSSRLLFLTQQLLEFRKAEYNYLEISVSQFDLVNLVEQIAELFDEWALEKNIEFNVKLPSELIGWYDKDKAEKIIFNLLSNAFKYTPRNGKIKLQLDFLDTNGNSLQIKVSNTGKGISKEKLDSLFDRFFLTDSESDNDMFRTGIGLAYIKRLVTVLKGKIEVLSKTNKLTTFTITIPCDKESFHTSEIDLEESQVLISQHLKNILDDADQKYEVTPNKISSLEELLDKRKVILIVDDEREIQLFLTELLSEKYKIIVASNGVEALKILRNQIPDVIITDVMMPKMDGIEFCNLVKSDNKTCHVPVIMLTVKSSILQRIEGLESGANSYIPKPFFPNHILVRVQKLIEERELILKYLGQDTFVENITELPVNNEEKELLRKVINLIRNNIENSSLQSSFIEDKLKISSSQLYRKIKQIFGFSPGDLIRTIRLKHAAELLRKSNFTVSEVCYQSGFNNRSYFYREFKKMYNTTPKNYQLQHKQYN